MILSDPHEQKVITAYRAQPDMQAPVDKLDVYKRQPLLSV